ncbi:GPP34 family phosphoprotein [Micromonospora endophytica]|uniref:Uncharacterized protein n=1 Tax=Micromonospora endophytica TaxID=515350 RepID=A0A2W2DME3_9ACTN|nr:GPP34 family phosphoprotein [Micromonospora endophytica]PZG00908.1 hypothetical protein C1I93_01150 [Micromonospora endophytica]RIW46247.1 hypothetical protein D3H59_13135 [Micromonospora endophytica]BCJ61764.1 hypothetical protein Jiend_51860 [Micromonospora endophytica]
MSVRNDLLPRPAADEAHEERLRARIRRILEVGETPDPRTAATIGLLFASGAMPSLRPPLPWTSTTVIRASEIARDHWGPEVVAAAVTRTAAAIVAASTACVATTTR